MYLSDYTIPEAEVIYQKAVIRGGWWFLAFLMACVLVYFVVHRITQDRMDARYHARQLERIKATEEIGHTGWYAMQANRGQTIRELQREIERKNRHIERLEETMDMLHFDDVAARIRKEIEDGKNESEDRS